MHTLKDLTQEVGFTMTEIQICIIVVICLDTLIPLTDFGIFNFSQQTIWM